MLRVLRALCVCCFVSLFLDSNPARSLGPPAKRFAHIVWVGFESSAVRWGSRSCLLGLPRLCSGGRGVGFSLFLVWTVFAWLSRRVGGCSLWGCSGISRLSTVWPLLVLSRAAREHAPCGGVVAGRGGVDCVCGVGMPRDCAWLVQLRGFLVFGAWCCLPGLRVCACLCAPCLVRGLCRRVLLRVYAALFVGCGVLRRVLPVCCCLYCLSAIVWVCVS